MLLSQERVAEMSGLSSYATLRALAVAFKTDVDLLEREFYAVKQSTDEFVEIPRWVRLLHDRLWFGGPRWSRRDFLVVEVLCLVLAVVPFGASFLVPQNAAVSAVRIIAIAPVICAYLVALSIRMCDRYRLWPGSENAPPEKPRTWRTIAAEYAFMFGVGILGTAIILWLMSNFK